MGNAGFPIITIEMENIYNLGKEYFSWEFATAIAGWALGIQPFDQPNVESAKVQARKLVDMYKETGKLPELKFNFKSYVAIQAYLKPDDDTTEALQKIRTSIQKKYKVATTLGYGPRFLHSTGQLHKGDSGNGLFIQIIGDPENDLPIPDNPGLDNSSISFGILIRAQALGDREAMLANQRKVLTFDLGNHVNDGLRWFLNASTKQM